MGIVYFLHYRARPGREALIAKARFSRGTQCALERVLTSVLAGAGLALGGCSFALGASVAPTIDTAATPGFDARAEVTETYGTRDGRLYLAFAGGGGLVEDVGGYGVVSPGIGGEFGYDFHVRVGAHYSFRKFVDEAELGIRHGGGADVEVLLPVMKHPLYEGPSLLLGPRLTAEGVQGLEPGEKDRGVFLLSLVFRWQVFDSKWFD